VLLVEKIRKMQTWYYKMKIYNAIAANDPLKTRYPDAYFVSLDALKKYVQLDDKKQILLIADGYKPSMRSIQVCSAGVSDYNEKKYNEG
jgi:hypothetical protein